MTDLEMTKLCAEAMGFAHVDRPSVIGCVYILDEGLVKIPCGDYNVGGTDWYVFDPLHDDAQAMALVKRFDMVIERDGDTRELFGVTIYAKRRRVTHDTFVVRHAADLNAAIVECVAKMQISKRAAAAPELATEPVKPDEARSK